MVTVPPPWRSCPGIPQNTAAHSARATASGCPQPPLRLGLPHPDGPETALSDQTLVELQDAEKPDREQYHSQEAQYADKPEPTIAGCSHVASDPAEGEDQQDNGKNCVHYSAPYFANTRERDELLRRQLVRS
jgi:hypothetical protein